MSSHDQSKISKYLDNKLNFLVYCGSPGIGKTYFCSALTSWVKKNFDTYRYWKEGDLLKRVRSEMDTSKGDYLESVKWLIDDQCLILDDVGSTGVNEWREEVLFQILDARYNSMLPTIITSNFSHSEFKKLYQPRVVDRIYATENTIIEIPDGTSLRSQGM
jgi:DNA replication protein DnaC